MHTLERRRALRHDMAAGDGLSDERDRLDRRMFGKRSLPALPRRAVDEIDDPLGSPAPSKTSLMISDRMTADNGLHSAGLCTMVQPAASAGAIFLQVDSA